MKVTGWQLTFWCGERKKYGWYRDGECLIMVEFSREFEDLEPLNEKTVTLFARILKRI